ncbi:F-box protein At2g02240-like [Eucalyptus grandis]|uniref:F-box protein At2g02240-like n=1 Tax=Eucalyptus grandis TaxID=71139 RepID=UPI00192EA710|nr:F-box protein At2g02240-like [Eucalyptus grandis]
MAVAEAKGRDCPDFSALPEGCIATVVSFTSPPDACRLASVSSIFKSACDSDAVWASFLPPDWLPMVSRSASSLKELYFSLCDDPVLVGDGTMGVVKRCLLNSWRFAEVAELIKVLWLEIRGTISSRMLSPRTLYAAYLVFKLTGNYNGFELPRFEVGAGFVGDEAGKRERSVVYLSRSYASVRLCRWDIIPILPEERRDGWSEIELGEFLTKDVQDGEVEMSVQDARGNRWMVGLVVEGIEIRPKDRK